jgi:hypothetical protein
LRRMRGGWRYAAAAPHQRRHCEIEHVLSMRFFRPEWLKTCMERAWPQLKNACIFTAAAP